MKDTLKQQNTLIEKLYQIEPDTKIVLTLENYFGTLFNEDAIYLGNIHRDGYTTANYEYWFKYPSENTVPCYCMEVRFPNARHTTFLKIGYTVKNVRIKSTF